MLRQEEYLFRRLNQGADVACALGALALAHWAGQAFLRPWVFPRLIEPSHLSTHGWAFLAIPAMLLCFQHLLGVYSPVRLSGRGSYILRHVGAAALTTAAAMAISAVTYRQGVLSRWLAIGGGGLLAVFMAAKALLVYQWLERTRRRGQMQRRLLVVGSGRSLHRLLRTIQKHPVWGFQVTGIVHDRQKPTPHTEMAGVPIVTTLDELIGYLEENTVDDVIFVPDRVPLSRYRDALETCELMGIRTRLALNFFEQQLDFATPHLDSFEGTPVVSYLPGRELADWRLLLKYSFDRVAALAALIILSPLFLGLWLMIRFTDGGFFHSAFFGQTRVGLNGRHFTCWKFRSMFPDAEQRLEELQKENEMSGPVFKMKDDPRITWAGRLLRKTSLDELPQLWNVLRGEMSLVGPRPPIPSEVTRYDRWQRRRLSMKPGITCIWQVSGRNLIDFETWMKMDLEYIDNWSLWLDVKILCRTVLVVITGYGAM